MAKYILKRLALSVLILLGVSLIIYVLIRLMPVDFIENKINQMNQGGATIPQETVDALYATYGIGDDSFLRKGKNIRPPGGQPNILHHNSLRSFSQLGSGRILMPDTMPMAIYSVRVDEPP